jgi:hypothetical protein
MLIRLGNRKPAAAVLSRALELLAPGTSDWHEAAYRLAFLLAGAGETEKYQALRRRTVHDFQGTTNVIIAERTSMMCLIAGSAQDPEFANRRGGSRTSPSPTLTAPLPARLCPTGCSALSSTPRGSQSIAVATMLRHSSGSRRAYLAWAGRARHRRTLPDACPPIPCPQARAPHDIVPASDADRSTLPHPHTCRYHKSL